MADIRIFQDQLNREVEIRFPPKRIISLVPSQTELLYDLGLETQIVGVTKFCVHPDNKLKKKTVVGGTKKFRFDVIEELQPDLIIGNKEENYQDGINELTKNYPVWMSDISNLQQAFAMMMSIGDITDRSGVAEKIVSGIGNGFESIPSFGDISTAYLIWYNPIMVAGKSTFIDDVLSRLGLINSITTLRYPETSIQKLSELKPELVLLSSEPFPFQEKHLREIQDALPISKVVLVDGEMFSWYGSRLLKAPAYFRSLYEKING
ncbi:MAG: helical backbone metal receptor [Cyclobacteriaceae bacterium]